MRLTELGDPLAAATTPLSDLAISSRHQVERSRRRFGPKAQHPKYWGIKVTAEGSIMVSRSAENRNLMALPFQA